MAAVIVTPAYLARVAATCAIGMKSWRRPIRVVVGQDAAECAAPGWGGPALVVTLPDNLLGPISDWSSDHEGRIRRVVNAELGLAMGLD